MKEIRSNFFKLLLCCILFSSTYSFAQLKTHDKNYFIRTDYLSDNKKLDSLDQFVDSLLRRYMQDPEVAGISIGISTKEKNYFYNYGEIKKQSGVLVDTTSIYEIGALTAGFTGFLLAQAIVEKKINPEADIRNYLPGKFSSLDYFDTPVRVKHLANHTSGLMNVPEDLKLVAGYDSLNPYSTYSREMILSYLKNTKPKIAPGTESDYSNLGIAVLGILLEDVYQKSFSELIAEKICLPIGLKNTAIKFQGDEAKNLTTGYDQNGNLTPAWNLGGFEAAGGLKCDTQDLLKYLNYLLHKKNQAAELILQKTFNGPPKMATTWYLSQTKKKSLLVSQSGATYGYGAFMGFMPEKNSAVVLLSNTKRNLDFLAIALFNYLQK